AVDHVLGKLADRHFLFQRRLGALNLSARRAAREGPPPKCPRYSSEGLPCRCRLMTERRFLPSRRRCFDALVGRVARRGTGGTVASRMSATRRSSASARLRSWVRWFWAMMTSTPSLVRRLPASRIRRTAMWFGSDGERRTSKRSCTAVDSLLTFWPPGP